MPEIAGVEVSKNTMVSVSLGTVAAVVVALWTIFDIGRPLFASDMQNMAAQVKELERKILSGQDKTAVQILQIRKQALQSDLRDVQRAIRQDPDDQRNIEDREAILSQIADIDAQIACYRTVGCQVVDGN